VSDPVFWKLPAVMWPWALLVMLVVALGEAIKPAPDRVEPPADPEG